MMRFIFVWLGLWSSANLCGQPLLPYSIEERCQESALIVEGEVVGSSTEMTVNGEIYTNYDFRISKLIQGDFEEGRLTFSSIGGEFGDYALKVCPDFHPEWGAKGILFLRESPSEVPRDYYPVSVSDSWIAYDNEVSTAFIRGVPQGTPQDMLDQLVRITKSQYKEIAPLIEEEEGDTPEALLITSFTPGTTQAGRGQQITVNGTDFGATRGVGGVFFRNVNASATSISVPAATYISWSNTRIVCEVPSRAGTGQIRVADNMGRLSPLSTGSLTITYNVTNVSNTEPRLIDDAGDGNNGYTFMYSDNTANNGVDFTSVPAAVDAVERAVNTWTGGTSFAIYGEEECGTSPIQVATADDVNIITFDNDAYDLDVRFGSSVLGVTFSYYSKCFVSEWEIYEIDMVLRRDGDPNMMGGSVDWEYGPSSPSGGEIDFESVVLHELGHGHGLGHTRVSGAVMFPSITSGTTNRNLSTSETSGGSYIHGESKSYTPPTLCGPSRQYDDHDPSQLCSIVLPLDLLSFQAQVEDDRKIILEWATANEVNHDRIVLQFHANSGWSDLQEFEALGNDQPGVNHYSYVHKGLPPEIYIYRLKMISQSGEVEYSPVVAAEIKGFDDRPNITVDQQFVYAEWHQRLEQGSLEIIDIHGRIHFKEYFEGKGQKQVNIDHRKFGAPGLYLLRIQDGLRPVEIRKLWLGF